MQQYLFRLQIELAIKYDLPLIFHIRDAQKQDEAAAGQAFDDFFTIVDEYQNIRGVVHSFSAGNDELQGVIARGLYVGLNGIMTFSKQKSQLQAAKNVPLEKLVLETDAPFLTPEPFRGRICKPEHLVQTAKFLSELRGESLEDLAKSTSANAKSILGI
jgi:TatD DNase family protein